MSELLIRKVYLVRASEQMLISIPKGNGIKPGDYVKVIKVEEKD